MTIKNFPKATSLIQRHIQQKSSVRLAVTALASSLVTMAIGDLVIFTSPAHTQINQVPSDGEYEWLNVKIPMRDGVKLFTVVRKPKNAKTPLPFILERTPYGAKVSGSSLDISGTSGELKREGYIFVFQDIRGRDQSQGLYDMNRPPCVTKAPNCLDEATDTYDTIEWLTKNIPGNNRRVGQLGISYGGWLTNASAFQPHPALKALSPQATMGDVWMGDDSFHQGAFRLSPEIEYVGWVESSRNLSISPIPRQEDMYDWYLSFPTLRALANKVKANNWPSWQRVVAHPNYDQEWQSRSIPRLLRQAPVPTLTVGGFWDQEDLYGPQATYAAMEQQDKANRNFLILGPWHHGQWAHGPGDSLGNLQFGSATGEFFRDLEARWFAYWLKDKGDGRFAEATVFDAGAKKWREFTSWPPVNATTKKLFLHPAGRLAFTPPAKSAGFTEYVSDPAQPVPYQKQPIGQIIGSFRWAQWMTEDQSFLVGRNDVVSWQTETLTDDVTVAGNIQAQLTAATTGEDADWVVKLIDVYPEDVRKQAEMSGYQLMVAGDIMRGRYRNSWQTPTRILPRTPTTFAVDLHQQAYTFRKGHKIMVQVQSSWFPVFDRNPQTWVPNIFQAPASAYRAQTHRIYHEANHPSFVQLQTLPY